MNTRQDKGEHSQMTDGHDLTEHKRRSALRRAEIKALRSQNVMLRETNEMLRKDMEALRVARVELSESQREELNAEYARLNAQFALQVDREVEKVLRELNGPLPVAEDADPTKQEKRQLKIFGFRQVSWKLQKMIAPRTESLNLYADTLKARDAQTRAARASLVAYMKKSEYQLILDCLDPERAPDKRQRKFAKALSIMERLETYVNLDLPLSALRERGWAL